MTDSRVSAGIVQVLFEPKPDARASTGIVQALFEPKPDARVSTELTQVLLRELPPGTYVRSAESARALLSKWPDDVWRPVKVGVWTWTDPLSSLSTLTVGSGTWTINGGVLETNPINANGKIRSNKGIDTSKDVHIVQVEIKMSSGYPSTDNHSGIGFNASSFGTGLMFSQLHFESGVTKVQFVSDGVVWRTGAAFTFTAGQWYKLRLRWNDTNDLWTVWLDGVQMVEMSLAQTEAAMYPTLLTYRAGTTYTTNYRNLSYWGGSTTDTQPPLEAAAQSSATVSGVGATSALVTQRGTATVSGVGSALDVTGGLPWVSDGYNGIINLLGQMIAAEANAALSTSYTYLTPDSSAPSTSLNGVPAGFTPTYRFVSSQSSNLDALRLSYRAVDHSNAENFSNATGGGDSHTGNAASSWWKMDLGVGHTLLPTRVGLNGRVSANNYNPRNFKIQGSTDNSNWVDLLVVTNNGPSSGAWWSAPITGASAYRYIRLLQTGANQFGDNHLVLGDIEFWGVFT